MSYVKPFRTARLLRSVLLVLACLSVQNAAALNTRTCFAHAQTVYETVYCEVHAELGGAKLPDYWDFKKNNEVMQALLLKKPARQLAINLPKPIARTRNARSITTPVAKSTIETRQQPAGSRQHNHCTRAGRELQCGAQHYTALGNTANAELDPGIWQASFKLQLQPFDGNYQNDAEVLAYLQQGYSRYLQHMIAIGLAGETFSFTKFAFFFDDHYAKGVDFAKRFEKMFYYLKQDKKNIAVSTALDFPASIDSRHCSSFGNILACAGQSNNYLFRKTGQ